MTLIGKVKLINNKTNECERVYSYDYLNENKNCRMELKNLLDEGTYKLLCGCNNHELKININYVIYLAKQNTKNLHHSYCPKSEIYETWVKKYNTGWKEEEGSDEIEVKLNFSLSSSNKRNFIPDYNPLRKRVYNNSDEFDGKISLLSLATHLNLITWKRVLKRDNQLIVNKSDYLGYIYGTAKNIKIVGKNQILQDIMFDFKRDKNLSSKDVRFIYGYIENVELNLRDNNEYILDIIYRKGQSKPFKFCINKENFIDMWTNLNYKNLKYIAVVGIVSKQYGIFKIIDFAMFNINTNGLYSESSYEIRYYNLLCKHNIPFYKPYKRMIEYEGHIPDGIIELDNKTIFMEIFGINKPEYLKSRMEKLEIIKKLKDTHILIKWDAFLGENMPTINEILEAINAK